MTDEEFERIKAAEKEHLRAKKRLQWMLAAVRKRNQAQHVVEQMQQGGQRLLQKTESMIDTLRHTIVKGEARLEGALGMDSGRDESLYEDEEELRKERAAELVRQYKSGTPLAASRPGGSSAVDASDEEDSPADDAPDKTIGRMSSPRSTDDEEQ